MTAGLAATRVRPAAFLRQTQFARAPAQAELSASPCVEEVERRLSRALVATKKAEKHRAKREAKRTALLTAGVVSQFLLHDA